MSLSEEARERLADIVELQPTKNKTLQERWGMESGSEVHQFLEGELKDYYYRDEDSLIRATAEARALVTGEDVGEDDPLRVHLSDLEQQILEVLAGPDERSQSVVSVLHDLENEFDEAFDTGEVRRALRTLERKGVADLIYRTVPTFRLAVPRDAVELAD
ncbi:DUF5797 family protein [Salarchaeum japonicum]|uniref:DUF5797 family protein n=1 Tax=Salarchaeum japonicum TaxID=555573 RepID=A0AAV3T627_9EURY|nr:DUF5797 family protein [Salarchaeum japonicum]